MKIKALNLTDESVTTMWLFSYSVGEKYILYSCFFLFMLSIAYIRMWVYKFVPFQLLEYYLIELNNYILRVCIIDALSKVYALT